MPVVSYVSGMFIWNPMHTQVYIHLYNISLHDYIEVNCLS